MSCDIVLCPPKRLSTLRFGWTLTGSFQGFRDCILDSLLFFKFYLCIYFLAVPLSLQGLSYPTPPPPGVKPRTLTVKVGVLTGGLEVHTEPRLVTVSAFAVPST